MTSPRTDAAPLGMEETIKGCTLGKTMWDGTYAIDREPRVAAAYLTVRLDKVFLSLPFQSIHRRGDEGVELLATIASVVEGCPSEWVAVAEHPVEGR